MPIVEILHAIIFAHRIEDDTDIEGNIVCIPDTRMTYLETELIKLQEAGVLDVVQIARYRTQATPATEYFDQVDSFLEKVSNGRYSMGEAEAAFTGFDDIPAS